MLKKLIATVFGTFHLLKPVQRNILMAYCCTSQKGMVDRLQKSISEQNTIGHDAFVNCRKVLFTDASKPFQTDLYIKFFDDIVEVEAFTAISGDKERFNLAKMRNASLNYAQRRRIDWVMFCDGDTVVHDMRPVSSETQLATPYVYWQNSEHETVSESIKIINSSTSSPFSEGNSWYLVGKQIINNFRLCEKIYGYGYEDIEFYKRLAHHGIQEEKIECKIIHLFHSQVDRMIDSDCLERNHQIVCIADVLRNHSRQIEWDRITILRNLSFETPLYRAIIENTKELVCPFYREIGKVIERDNHIIVNWPIHGIENFSFLEMD